MRGVARDLREAWRSTRCSPGLSSVVVAIVALGVAVTTSVFCAVNAICVQAAALLRAWAARWRFTWRPPTRIVVAETPASYALFRANSAQFASVGAFVERSTV